VIRDIIHININVQDVERSIAFYQKLGFKVMHVFGDKPTDDVTEGMDYHGSRMRGAVISTGDHPRAHTKIELIQWLDTHGEPDAAEARGQQERGVSRIALRTKDLIDYCDSLRRDGIEFEQEPREIDIVGAKRFALFRDPDGTLLELIEF
jgi:glyoxylase I family protein